METTETTVPVLSADEQQRNTENVLNSVKYSGFNASMNNSIREAIQNGVPDHAEKYRPDFAGNVEATLHFRRSDKGFYFFNKFDVEVSGSDGNTVKRSFYVNKADKLEVTAADGQKVDEYVNTNFSLKEAYNLLEGRAVLKDFTKKNKETGQLERYQAWVLVDFKNTDKQGNYKLLKRPVYNLEAKMRQFNIRDMDVELRRNQLMTSLERGNLQSVTVIVGSRTETYKFAANPDYNSVSIYDKDNIPVKHTRLKHHQQSQGAEPAVNAAQTQDMVNIGPVQADANVHDAPVNDVREGPVKVQPGDPAVGTVNKQDSPDPAQDLAGKSQAKTEKKQNAEGADGGDNVKRPRNRIPRNRR